jgi:hypothetical protein
VHVPCSWDNFFEEHTEKIGENLDEQLADEHRLRAEVLSKELVSLSEANGEKHTKIWPKTAPKQDRPTPRNHMRKVNAGSVGSSSSEMRRVATSRSVSRRCQ